MIGRASQEAEIAWPLVRKPTTYTRPLLRKGRLEPERTLTVKNSSGAPMPRPTGRVAFHSGGVASVASS